MQKSKPSARISILYWFCQRLKFPLLLLLLCTSSIVLYNSWDVVFTPKVYVPTVLLTPKQNTLVTLSEVHTDQKTRFTSGGRPSQQFHSTSSEVQDDLEIKLSSEGRSLATSEVQTEQSMKHFSFEFHSTSSAAQDDSEMNLSLEGQYFPEIHSKSSHKADVPPTKQSERRRSLLIYGADRSGTTFTTQMFAQDPQILTVYEPLWITSQWHKENKTEWTNWRRNVQDVLEGILSCKFAESKAGTRFLSHTSGRWGGAPFKNPFKSLPFCAKQNNTCKDLSSDPSYADNVCQTKFKHSVVKISEERTPNNLISTFIPAIFLENPGTDIRVIQLVRDPRGSLNSRIKLRWMKDYRSPNFQGTVRKVCVNLAENIKFGRNLDKWQDKFLEVDYKDLTGKPIETTKLMYKFAGFEMPDSVLDWVIQSTSPSKEELSKEQLKWYSTVRNSTANVEKWREESPIERIRVIEEECSEALDLLGLTKVT